jgi:ATPase subunit of ABC transporter with duplicated ATPase domains
MAREEIYPASIKYLNVLSDTVKNLLKIGVNNDFLLEDTNNLSTLIKTMLGVNELPYTGSVLMGPSVKIGYLPQVINFKKEDQKVLDCFKEEAYLDEQKARAILASFHFYKDDVNKIIKNLSGGERVRLKLAILLQGKVNCLIFDEPTNHIDISTKEVLENAISDFKGTLIFISHDRFFINKFANKVIEFKNGQIRAYIGNYDNYKEHKNVDK